MFYVQLLEVVTCDLHRTVLGPYTIGYTTLTRRHDCTTTAVLLYRYACMMHALRRKNLDGFRFLNFLNPFKLS